MRRFGDVLGDVGNRMRSLVVGDEPASSKPIDPSVPAARASKRTLKTPPSTGKSSLSRSKYGSSIVYEEFHRVAIRAKMKAPVGSQLQGLSVDDMFSLAIDRKLRPNQWSPFLRGLQAYEPALEPEATLENADAERTSDDSEPDWLQEASVLLERAAMSVVLSASDDASDASASDTASASANASFRNASCDASDTAAAGACSASASGTAPHGAHDAHDGASGTAPCGALGAHDGAFGTAPHCCSTLEPLTAATAPITAPTMAPSTAPSTAPITAPAVQQWPRPPPFAPRRRQGATLPVLPPPPVPERPLHTLFNVPPRTPPRTPRNAKGAAAPAAVLVAPSSAPRSAVPVPKPISTPPSSRRAHAQLGAEIAPKPISTPPSARRLSRRLSELAQPPARWAKIDEPQLPEPPLYSSFVPPKPKSTRAPPKTTRPPPKAPYARPPNAPSA